MEYTSVKFARYDDGLIVGRGRYSGNMQYLYRTADWVWLAIERKDAELLLLKRLDSDIVTATIVSEKI